MFALTRPTFTRSRSTSTTSTLSSISPNTPPPTILLPFFAGSLKSSLSPPATTRSTSTTDYFSLFSPPITPFSPSASSPGSCISTAYPSWPQRASLAVSIVDRNPNESIHSPTHRRASSPGYSSIGDVYHAPNSYISDADLLDLEGWGLSCADEGGAIEDEGLGISWSAVGQQALVVVAGGAGERRRSRGQPPVVRKRERSRSVKRKPVGRVMSTIAE
ncbi:hypothetical protein MMC19_007451 [Ptychographa xylographoides]|nr:hypothetical protein [Ptychographa xylographoides]